MISAILGQNSDACRTWMQVGTRVRRLWKTLGKWYSGTVVECNPFNGEEESRVR